jgi:hypothetical protein
MSGFRTSEANLSLKMVSALAIKNSDMFAWRVMLCSMSYCMQSFESISRDLLIEELVLESLHVATNKEDTLLAIAYFKRFGAHTMARFLVFILVSDEYSASLCRCFIKNESVLQEKERDKF